MRILADLFYGNIRSENLPVSEESQALLHEVVVCEEQIREQIADKEKAHQLMTALSLAGGKLNSLREEECFSFGFTLAAHLMMEIFQKELF